MASQDQSSNHVHVSFKESSSKKVDESRWDERAGGYRVFKKNTKERVLCPKDGSPIVYNGNYFCSKYEVRECTWALPHPARSKKDKEVCDLIGIDYY